MCTQPVTLAGATRLVKAFHPLSENFKPVVEKFVSHKKHLQESIVKRFIIYPILLKRIPLSLFCDNPILRQRLALSRFFINFSLNLPYLFFCKSGSFCLKSDQFWRHLVFIWLKFGGCSSILYIFFTFFNFLSLLLLFP